MCGRRAAFTAVRRSLHRAEQHLQKGGPVIARRIPSEGEDLRLGIRGMDSQLHGFAHPDAVLTGVETRSSSPVRIPRAADLMAEEITGLYPVGEGAGYAGGIVSAAVDGIRCALAAIERSLA